MNDIRTFTLTQICNYIQDVSSAANIEKSIYNYCIRQSKKAKIIPSWENVKFVSLYKIKSFYIVHLIQEPHIRSALSEKKIKGKDIAEYKDLDNIFEEEIEEGIFECKKCGSKKTSFYSLQTRSADEPMTNFITCLTCQNRWKM
jgi:DNA-directed RNA polymerase subunit M/transcription elongation factor TFIIS